MDGSTPHGLEIRHLRAFEAVARLASFTHAAQELMITQPALSRTIRRLEELLRVRLFDRSTRHVTLTDAGATFLAHAIRVLTELDRAVGAARRQGTIKLGFGWLLPTPWAQDTLARFESATGSSVELIRTDDPLAAVRQGKVDLALIRGDVPNPRLRIIPLFEETRVAVCAERYPLAADLDWSEIPRWPLVVNTVSGTTGAWSWPDGDGPTTIVETANFDEWIETIAAGRGIGVAPDIALRRHIHPSVRFVPITNAPKIPVSLAFLPSANGPALRRFLAAALHSVGSGRTSCTANSEPLA
ncbi:LysR family transcriptional regulator [Nocardia panacis]|uniref:LysR family transcriptional regulator n=1 Tax=Nocardia panacis TaxID=2340916 RepID=A0A3A4K0H7_9NOCA|nr:LysR family transcriptional regulator [Nocardia panacis]RJO70763.1 LysR family transcriptional regulator [Nocardia panacis]